MKRKKTVYLTQHLRLIQGAEEIKTIGIYSSRRRASAVVKRLRLLPGFRRYPKGFSIDSYELDQDHWTSGFFTTRPGAWGRRRVKKRSRQTRKTR